MKYGDKEKKVVYTVSGTAITNADNIENGGLYVIYNTNARRYLYDNGDNVGAGSPYNNNGVLNHNYVWKFTSTGNNRYTIKSMVRSGELMVDSGNFMQSSEVSNSAVPLTTSAGSSDYFTASTTDSSIRFLSTKSSYYLSVNSRNTVYGHNSNSNQTRRNFQLYKVTEEGVIPISIIDKNTGEASSLTAIKRNDFINIRVNVTYNEKTGQVVFEVDDWNKVNGDVTFD